MDFITDAPYMSCLLETPAPRPSGDTTLMPFRQEFALSAPVPILLVYTYPSGNLLASQSFPVNLPSDDDLGLTRSLLSP